MLDTINGPIIPHAKLTRSKNGSYKINDEDYLLTKEEIEKDYIYHESNINTNQTIYKTLLLEDKR